MSIQSVINGVAGIGAAIRSVMASLQVEAQGPQSLTLTSHGRRIVADAEKRFVYISGRPVAGFDVIQGIELEHRRTQKGREWWVVHLLMPRQKRLRLGSTADGADGSIVAARLSRITGKEVRCASSWSSF